MSGVLLPGAGPGSTAPADNPGELAAQDNGSQPRGYYIGGCGHRRPLWTSGQLGPCEYDFDPA